MGVSTSPGRIIAEPSKETSLRTDRLSHFRRRMSLFLQMLVLRDILSSEQDHRQGRFWIASLLFDHERPGVTLPAKYLKKAGL